MKTITASLGFVLVLVAAALAGSLQGVLPTGRYALDMASCKAKDYFATLTETALALPTFSCKGVEYDQTEDKGGRQTYAVTAKACMGEESDKPRPDKFGLVVENDALQILWADGTKSAKLPRCPRK
jgi:hypothetical protein